MARKSCMPVESKRTRLTGEDTATDDSWDRGLKASRAVCFDGFVDRFLVVCTVRRRPR